MMPFRILLVVMLAILTGGIGSAHAQLNFQPLQEGDYQEVSEKIIILKAIEVDAAYGIWVRKNSSKDLKQNDNQTVMYHEALLGLRTIFHQDVSINLHLQLADTLVKDSRAENFRNQSQHGTERRLAESSQNPITAQQVYLDYYLNPTSLVRIGKQRLQLGDRYGKVFDGIVPALQFNCMARTWCVPFGIAFIGNSAADALQHIAFKYPAWNEGSDIGSDRLEFNLFVVSYKESNVPLAKHLGPGAYNPTSPNDLTKNTRLVSDSTASAPVYYDATGHNFYGFTTHWNTAGYYLDIDLVASQGERTYHPFRQKTGDFGGKTLDGGVTLNKQKVRGEAYEVNSGFRFDDTTLGLRVLLAKGDPYQDPTTPEYYKRELRGYHALTPHTYQGSRLFFNGNAFSLSGGDGLGHALTNVHLNGIFIDWRKQSTDQVSLSAAIYQLRYDKSIKNIDGKSVVKIGTEVNTMLRYPLRDGLYLDAQINYLSAGSAFRLTDVAVPVKSPDDLLQTLLRVMYVF